MLSFLQWGLLSPSTPKGLKALQPSMRTLLPVTLTSIKKIGGLKAFLFGKLCSSETLAWLHAQGSHHSLQGPGKESASTTPGGGRPSPSFSLSCLCSMTVIVTDTKLEDLRAALPLVRRPEEREGSLQVEDGPLDGKCLSQLGTRRAFPALYSTRSVSSSWGLAHGTLLTDICKAAGWATPNTFARFYSLCGAGVCLCSHLKWVEAPKGPRYCQLATS